MNAFNDYLAEHFGKFAIIKGEQIIELHSDERTALVRAAFDYPFGEVDVIELFKMPELPAR